MELEYKDWNNIYVSQLSDFLDNAHLPDTEIYEPSTDEERSMTWNEAEEFCNDKGMRLLTVQTSEKFDVVKYVHLSQSCMLSSALFLAWPSFCNITFI